jgi:hypothetical protein
MLQSLDGIERLQATSSLGMEWAKKISDLGPVFKMIWLKSLSVSDFECLTNIEGIGELEDLKALHLSEGKARFRAVLTM